MTENFRNIINIEFKAFQLFYVEAIFSDSSFPQINTMQPLFEKMTKEEFVETVTKLVENRDEEALQTFLYYIFLFRDMPHLQEYINSEDFSIELLEKFIIFIYGYCTIYGHTTERVIDEVLYFLNDEKLIDLLNHSSYLSRDKLLTFLILSNFSIESLNRFFSQIQNIPQFVDNFLRLPDEILRSIITRNYHLFQYIIIMMSESKTEKHEFSEFYNRYKEQIIQFSKLNDIVRKYKKSMNYEKEKNLPFNKRDMARISYLVNMIRELPDHDKAIEYFYSENIFVDEAEKNIVRAIVTDPMFKNTFKHYDEFFGTD